MSDLAAPEPAVFCLARTDPFLTRPLSSQEDSGTITGCEPADETTYARLNSWSLQ